MVIWEGVKMKRVTKIVIAILIFVCVIALMGKVHAASASVNTSSTTITKGQSATITVSVSKTEVYNLRISSSGGTLSGTTADAESFGAEKSKSVFTATFKASTAGKYTINLSGDISGKDLKKKSVSSSVTITVKEASSGTNPNSSSGTSSNSSGGNSSSSSTNSSTEIKKSNIANLKTLVPSVGELVPEFDKKTKEYVIYVENEVTKMEFKTSKEDSKSTYTIKGNEKLKIGENTVTITVTAEDGTTNKYKIKVIRAEEFIMQLNTLSITGYRLNPEFSPEIYEYKINVVNDVESVEVIATSNMENIPVEITGQDNLEIGENIVIITMRSADGSKTQEYKIIVNKEEQKSILTSMAGFLNSNKLDKEKLIVGGVAFITLVTIVMLVIEGYKERKVKTEPIQDKKSKQGTLNTIVKSVNKLTEVEKKEEIKSGSGKHF